MAQKQVALITGASRGIGKTVAEHLAQRGYNLALVARNEQKLEQVKQELEKTYDIQVSVHACDVSQKEIVEKSIQEIISIHKQIDILFNNAGIAIGGTSDIDPEDFEAMIQVNLLGAFYILHSVIPHMKLRQSGYIFNLVSRSGMEARPSIGGYAASKFGLRGYNEALYKELAPQGIKVTALHPGWVKTDMTQDVQVDSEKMLQSEDIAKLVETMLDLSQYAFVKDILIEPLPIIELANYRA